MIVLHVNMCMANMQVIAKTKPPASADMQLITGNQHRNPKKMQITKCNLIIIDQCVASGYMRQCEA